MVGVYGRFTRLIFGWDLLQLDGLLEKGSTKVVHLMANRLRERTLIGYAAAGPAGPE